MPEKSNTSPNLRPVSSYISNPLTARELESLMKEMEEAYKIFDQLSEEEFQRKEVLGLNDDDNEW